MNTSVFPLSMLATVIAITVLLAYVPQISQPRTPMGVRVPTAKLNHPVVRTAISKYRMYVIVSGVVSAILVAAFSTSMPAISALSTLVVTFISIGAYVIQRKRIITTKQAEDWFKDAEFAVSGRIANTKNAQLSDEKLAAIDALPQPHYPWVYFLLSLVSLAVSVLIVAANWDEIPQTIATHWGPEMQPDAWSTKSVGSVFFASFMSLGMLVLLFATCAAIVKGHVHNRSDRSIRGQLRTQVMLAATVTGLGIVALTMTIGFSFLQVISALPRYQNLMGLPLAVIMIGTIGATIGMLIILVNHQGKTDDILRGVNFGDESKESPDNDAFYKWGMFYYNPDDPAVLVEKRFGAGVDFNYARWQGKVFVAVMLAILVGSLALVFV